MKIRSIRYSFLFAAMLSLFVLSSSGKAQTKPWVTAYYCGWELGDGTNGYLPVSDVDFTAMSYVVHFAIVPNADGSLNTTDNDITTAGAAALTTAAHAVGTKVLISIGGWSSESGFLGATSSSNLNTFVSNLVAFIKNNNYDGIDIDWEPEASSDDAQYEALMKALRTALGSTYTITTTAGDAAAMAAVQSYVDQINIMTYDMAGPWQGWVSWYNSAINMYGTAATNGSEASASVGAEVTNYLNAGVSAAKLGIGSEFAGAVWTGVNGPNQSWTTAPTVQEDVPLYASDGSGIMQKYYDAQNYHWDSQAQASYVNSSNTFVTYEDTNDVNAKFNYVKTKGLGGMIIYSLGMGYPGNGTYPLLAQFKRDMGGSSVVTTPKDTVAPSISITAPTTGSTILGTVAVTANATDNVGVTGVTFKVDGNALGSTLTVAPYTASLVTTTLSNGSHTITATASDAAGNTSTASVSVTVSNPVSTADTTAPVVSITSPANNSTVSNTVTVSANATDNVGVTGVQFKLDGSNLGSVATTSPYSVSWTTTGVSNGTHTLSAVASDAAGNTATSTVTVNVSNSASTTQTSASNLWIYNNALASGWSNGSWGVAASSSFNNNQIVYPGCKKSIKVVQDPSGALRLLSGGWNALVPFDPSPYTSVSFEIYSTYSINLSVYLMGGPSGVTFPTVNYGSVPNSSWTTVTIPFSQLDPSNQTFTMLVITDESGNTVSYYIDNLQFVGFPSPTLATPTNGNSSIIDPVSLVWNPCAGATSYRVQLSTSQNFSTTVYDTSNVAVDSVYVTGLQAGTTYYWRVDASGSGLTSQWSPVWSFSTIAPPVSSTSGMTIYGDALNSSWFDASWNATLNFSNTSPVYSGTNSISVDQGTWGGASFHYGAWNGGQSIDPTQYSAVQFAVYSSSQTTFNVGLESDAGTSFASVSAGTVPAGQWTVITVPLSSLDPNNATFTRIDIMEESGVPVTYYLDNIQLNAPSKAKVATAGADGSALLPKTMELGQNYPNPFNPTTDISFALPKAGHVVLKVYNSIGQEVGTLVDGYMEAGVHSVRWDGSRLASGVYFYRMQVGSRVFMKKMLMLK